MPVSGTTITSSADVNDAQIEKVRNQVQELFETSDTVAALVKKSGEAEVISEKLYRIPLVKSFGGVFGKFDANAGDMGSGSGPTIVKMTAGFVYSRYTFEIATQAIDSTANASQSAINTWSYVLKGAIKQLQSYDDVIFHTDGTGALTNGASTGGADYLTFAGTTDKVGVIRLKEGMAVKVYDSSAGAFMGSGATYTISNINYSTKVVTFTGNLGATGASGDYLVVCGITDAPPVSWSSTYPATITADSFRHGLYYFNDYDSSHYVLGLLKSANPQLLPSAVNANGDLLTYGHVQLALDQLVQRRNPGDFKGLLGLVHMAQAAQVKNLGVSLTHWVRNGGEKVADFQPTGGYEDSFPFCGLTVRVDKRQQKDRFDAVDFSKFGRAMLHDTKFHEVGGKTIFESRATTGNLKAAQHFHIIQAEDYFCVDSGSGIVVYGLALPDSGY